MLRFLTQVKSSAFAGRMVDEGWMKERSVTGNLLPELGDGGDQGQVGGVGRQHEGLVHAAGVLDAAGAVPGVVALGPGQLGLKTLTWTESRRWNESQPSRVNQFTRIPLHTLKSLHEPTWNR